MHVLSSSIWPWRGLLEVWPSQCPPGCEDTRGLEGAAEKQVKKLGPCSRPEYLAATRNYKYSTCHAAQEATELKTWIITSLDLKYLDRLSPGLTVTLALTRNVSTLLHLSYHLHSLIPLWLLSPHHNK